MNQKEANEKLNSLSRKSAEYWCDAGACACLGCANFTGVTKEQWQKWLRTHPPRSSEAPKEPLLTHEEELVKSKFITQAVLCIKKRKNITLQEAKEVLNEWRNNARKTK